MAGIASNKKVVLISQDPRDFEPPTVEEIKSNESKINASFREINYDVHHISTLNEDLLVNKNLFEKTDVAVFFITTKCVGNKLGLFAKQHGTENSVLLSEEQLIAHLSTLPALKNCFKIIVLLIYCDEKIVGKPIHLSNCTNTIVIHNTCDHESRIRDVHRNDILVETICKEFVNQYTDLSPHEMINRVHNVSKSKGIEPQIMSFPCQKHIILRANPRALGGHNRQPEYYSWFANNGRPFTRGNCISLYDASHCEIAKQFAEVIGSHSVTTEVVSIDHISEVLDKVCRSESLYESGGCLVVAVFSRNFQTGDGQFLIDTGPCLRSRRDLVEAFENWTKPIIFLYLDCRFDTIDPSIDQVKKSSPEVSSEPPIIEFVAQGKQIIENFLNGCKRLSEPNLSLQQTLQEVMDSCHQNEYASLYYTLATKLSFEKCTKLELLSTLIISKGDTEVSQEYSVSDVAKDFFLAGARKCLLLTGNPGSGKTVASLQLAKHLLTNFPSHHIIYASCKLLEEIVTVSEAQNFLSDLIYSGVEEEEKALVKKKFEEKKIIILLDDLHMVLHKCEQRTLKLLNVLGGQNLPLWLVSRFTEQEKIKNCLLGQEVVKVEVAPLTKESQIKILSAECRLNHEDGERLLKTLPSTLQLDIPLHISMIDRHFKPNATSLFHFYCQYVEDQLRIEVNKKMGSECAAEMFPSIRMDLIYKSAVQVQSTGYYDVNYKVFGEVDYFFYPTFAEFFVALNFMCFLKLVDYGINGSTTVENLFTQSNLAPVRMFVENFLSNSGNTADDVEKVKNLLLTDSLKAKAHDCIYNVVKEGHLTLYKMFTSPFMRQHLEIDNIQDSQSGFSQKWNKKYQHSPLFYASKSNEQIALLIISEFPVRATLLNLDFNTHEAAKRGFLEVDRIIAEKLPGSLNEPDSNGMMALHYAALMNQTEWVKRAMLMNMELEVNGLSKHGVPPVFYAAGNGNFEIIRILLICCANLQVIDKEGSTILHWVFKKKNLIDLKILTYLLSLKSVPINEMNNEGDTALLLAVKIGNIEAARILLEAGADPQLADSQGMTILHIAAKSKNANIFLEIMTFVPDTVIFCADKNGRTPLHLAAENGHISILQVLMEKGAHMSALDANGWNALHYAVKGKSDCLGWLLEKMPRSINEKDKAGKTLVHLAVQFLFYRGIHLMAELRADLNVKDMLGKTPLQYALDNKNARAIKIIQSFTQINENERTDVSRVLSDLDVESLACPNDALSTIEDEFEDDEQAAGPSGLNAVNQDGNVENMDVDCKSLEEGSDEDNVLEEYERRKKDLKKYQVHGHLNNLKLQLALHRFFTFPPNFDSKCPTKRIHLAQSGFFCTLDGNSIQCFYCALEISIDNINWGDVTLEQVNAKHDNLSRKKYGRACPLLKNNDVGDVPVINPSSYIYEAHRLYSLLSSRWINPNVKEYDLAKWGFYYTGVDDNCRCVFCKLEVRGWEPGDKAEGEHRRWNPKCPFLQSSQTDNVQIGEELTVRNDDNPFITTPIKKYGDHVHYSKNLRQNVSVEMLGITPIGDMKYRQYSTVHSREKSYNNWPKQLSQKPEMLCDAGFFYTGTGDRVLCFQCGGGLKDWDPKDKPWIEHAKWFSRCPYLNIKKGKKFIDKVVHSYQDAEEVATDGPEPKVRSADPPGSLLCWLCKDKDVNCVSLPCGHMTTCVGCVDEERKCRACGQVRSAYAEVFM
ncbi:uncharacterized protein LOC132202487 [Neocloeon triangulifer]|uniref:uncharacterized protein LOC132202487 n=1 Tax=Neocloeon triangulifer TaxID=2078957 RepID=UPI00286F1225|nr:uncharacterized protein LOC132202487 [Neocloeon triangulifer]XP_059485432.1 uncharacterized protein LOC132202487 [Neocloeon triangulifer]